MKLALTAYIAILAGTGAFAETKTALFAGGCFWCVEADFEKVDGVIEAVSGFAGGTVENLTYKEVTRGGTGHLEVAQITYDDEKVSYEQLVDLFFRSIDPTDAGGQFCDRGESYTTAIFVSNAREREIAEQAKADAAEELGQEIVTPIRDDATFYEAEEYHQDYYKKPDLILSRFGPISKEKAYDRYREGCGRDQRIRELWGDDAPFVGG